MVHLESSSQESSSLVTSTDVGIDILTNTALPVSISGVLKDSNTTLDRFIAEAISGNGTSPVIEEMKDDALESVYAEIGKATKRVIQQRQPELADAKVKEVITRFLSTIRPVIKDLLAALPLL